jgi:hypothetical protein
MTFVISYVQSCATGAVRIQDCGPVWQLGLIAGLVAFAIVALVAMRLSGRPDSVRPANG